MFEGGSTVLYYGIEGIARMGGAWGNDPVTSAPWSAFVLGFSIGWRIPLVFFGDAAAEQTVFNPSFSPDFRRMHTCATTGRWPEGVAST